MYKVDKTIIEKAECCDKNLACLSEENHPSCKIDSCVGNKIHFVEKLERECKYYQEFGFSYICKCPVRIELYNKYKI